MKCTGSTTLCVCVTIHQVFTSVAVGQGPEMKLNWVSKRILTLVAEYEHSVVQNL